MAVGLILPQDPDALSDVLTDMVARGEVQRNREKIRWLLITLYMQGVRDFTALDWATGSVVANYEGGVSREEGMRFEKLLDIYQTEYGRFMQMNLSPVAGRKGQGLDSLRKASTAQLVLDNAISAEQVQVLTQSLLPPFLRGGHLGIGAFSDGGSPRLELIPGWELMGWPIDPVISENVDAIFRIRWVTKTWLIDNNLLTEKQATVDEAKLSFQNVPVGVQPERSDVMAAGGAILGRNSNAALSKSRSSKSEDERKTQWTRLVECWTRDREDHLQQYAPMAGKLILGKLTDVTGDKVPMPIQSAKYVDTGGFYGRGLMEQLIPLNNEVEYMLNQLFRNIEDLDLYGVMCLSNQMGISKEEVQEARRSSSKVLMYQPDVFNPQAQPFNLKPANAGKFPVDVINIALGLMQTQSRQSEMLSGDAPGRVDSASALSFLYETGNIPLTGPTESISTAVTRAYRSLLYQIKQDWSDRKVVELTLDDDILVGINYDPQSGQVTLEQDAIPNPDEVKVTIAAKMPVSDSAMKQELKEQLQAQIITPRQYRIEIRKRGLNVPVANEYEWQSYRTAKLENIMLYGNGEEPGQAIPSKRDYHEVHLEVLQAFMARPEYRLAKEAVQNAFVQHLEFHFEEMGQFPEGMPHVGNEDEIIQAAQMANQQREQMMAMAQGQGEPDQEYRL